MNFKVGQRVNWVEDWWYLHKEPCHTKPQDKMVIERKHLRSFQYSLLRKVRKLDDTRKDFRDNVIKIIKGK